MAGTGTIGVGEPFGGIAGIGRTERNLGKGRRPGIGCGVKIFLLVVPVINGEGDTSSQDQVGHTENGRAAPKIDDGIAGDIERADGEVEAGQTEGGVGQVERAAEGLIGGKLKGASAVDAIDRENAAGVAGGENAAGAEGEHIAGIDLERARAAGADGERASRAHGAADFEGAAVEGEIVGGATEVGVGRDFHGAGIEVYAAGE